MNVFNDYAYYYDKFYDNKNYKQEALTVNNILKKYEEKKSDSLLLLGCGTGKHDTELARLGYHTHGIDISSSMIIQAMQNNTDKKNSTFEVADIRTYVPTQKYDAVISLFHVFSYQKENEDILQAFQTANDALEKDGIFLFDVWYGPGVLSDKPSVRVKKIEDDKNILIRYANPVMHADKNLVDVCYEIIIIDKNNEQAQNIKEVHHMRYFFKPELKYFLEQAGFELIDCLDCNKLENADYNSWTAYFIARKTKRYSC